MIKIFEKEHDWQESINFVDDNNVFIGYNLAQDCCEEANWFISENIERNILKDPNPDEFELTQHVIDPEFFEEISPHPKCDEGGVVIFRFYVPGVLNLLDLYLHLYNVHNGYYTHGFTVRISEEVVKDGCI